MTSTLTACPGCTRPVPTDAPEGLCPDCLLSQCLPGADAPTFVPASRRPQPPAVDELARSFPNLEILELIGTGGMGHVYRARQTGLDRQVALKILHDTAAHDAAFAERFEREARALARLSHPHIVGVHEAGRAGPYCYLVMEYVDGTTLRDLIAARQLAPAHALALVPQICEALEYAHGAGVVHRDIKPENILLSADGRIKIADFGLAKLVNADGEAPALTQPQQVMGTLHYMAPEQFRGALAVDHRADIYSLGVVLYEMLTGELPLGRFEPPSQRAQVDARLDDVVLRTLERDPNRRYQRAAHVKTEIDSIRDVPGGRPREPERKVPTRPVLRATLAAVALLLGLSFLPWGVDTVRSKFDIDHQFLVDTGGAAGDGTIYLRAAGCDWVFVPEGQPASAWTSRLELRGTGSWKEWSLPLPNALIPLMGLVTGLLLVFRTAGRTPPRWVIPLLASAGLLLSLVVCAAIAHRGELGTSAYTTCLAFGGCLLLELVSVTRTGRNQKVRQA